MDLATIWDFHFVWYRDDLVQPRVKLEQLNFGLRDPNFHTRHTCIKFKITISVAFMNCVSSILLLQEMILHQLYILFQNIIWNTFFFILVLPEIVALAWTMFKRLQSKFKWEGPPKAPWMEAWKIETEVAKVFPGKWIAK